MPEQGTSWTLNVIVDDKEAQEHIKKIEETLDSLTKINFTLIEQNIKSIIKDLDSLASSATKATNALASLSSKQSQGISIQQQVPVAPTVAPYVMAPVGTVLDTSSLTDTLKLAKQQVGKESGLFNIRPKLDPTGIDRIKKEIEILSETSGIKLKFSEKDVSGAINGIVRVIDKLNEELFLRPDIDDSKLKGVVTQLQKTIAVATEVFGPELEKTMQRVDLSAFSKLLSQFSEQGIERGIQSVDATPIAKEISVAVQDAFNDLEFDNIKQEIEESVSEGINEGIKVLDTISDEINESLSAKRTFQDSFDYLEDLFKTAQFGDILADNIRRELTAMKPAISNLLQVDPSQVGRIFAPWQSHLVKMANELSNLSGAAFNQKQAAMLAFLNKHIILDNISVKLGIEGIPDISAEVQETVKEFQILDTKIKEIKADFASLKIADPIELDNLFETFDAAKNEIPKIRSELELMENAMKNGINTIKEYNILESIFNKLNDELSETKHGMFAVSLAEDYLIKLSSELAGILEDTTGFSRFNKARDIIENLTDKVYELRSAFKQFSIDTEFDTVAFQDIEELWERVKIGINEANIAGVKLDYTIESLSDEFQKLASSNTNFDFVSEVEKLKTGTTKAKIELNQLSQSIDKVNNKADELSKEFETLDDLEIKVETKNAVQKLEDIKQAIFNLNETSDNADIQKVIEKWTAFAHEIHEAGGYSTELKTSLVSLGTEINNLFKASTGKTFGELNKQIKASSISSTSLANSLVNTSKNIKSLVTRAAAIKALQMGVTLGAWTTGLHGVDIAINQIISSVAGMYKIPGTFNAMAASASAAASSAGAAASNTNKIPKIPLVNIFSAMKTGSDNLALSITNTVRQVEILGSKLGQFSMAGMGLMFVQQYVMSTFSKAMEDQSNLGDAIVNTALLIKQEYGGTIQNAEKTTVGMLNNVAAAASNSRDELAKAMQTTVQAGFADPKELAYIMDVSDAVATATNTKNVSNISQMLSGLVFAFNKDVKVAKQFGNEFAVALNKTSLEAEDLATVVNYTVGQTAALGLEFSDMLTYAALLRKGGMEPSSIGTSIRSLLIDVSSMKGELGKFIKAEGIGIPKGIEQYADFADKYGAILEQRKAAAEQLAQLQVEQKKMKGAGLDTKGISQQISTLQGQIGEYDLQTKSLNETYKDVSTNAVKFFGDVFKSIGKARKEGKISEEQFNKMFDTVQSTAANIFANSFVDQEQYIKDLNKAIRDSEGYSESVRDDKMQTTKGRLQRVQNEIGRLMGVIYASFSQSITKIGELIFKYGPQLEHIISIVATEITRLADTIYGVIDSFMAWFSSLNDSTKAFIINKALIVALIGLIGGPLMVYIGAIGSAMAGFATTILSAAGALTWITDKFISFFNIAMLGTDFRFMKSMTMMGKMSVYVDMLKKSLATPTRVQMFDDLYNAATAKDWKTFFTNWQISLTNMRSGTKTSLSSVAGMFTNFGNRIKGIAGAIPGIITGIGGGAGIMNILRTSLQGVLTLIPMLITGFGALTIAALPYIAAIIAIIGAVYLLYRAWSENVGNIQGVTKDAFGAVVDFLKGAYDFIMSIIAPIVHVIDTIGYYFVKIFDAIAGGNWQEVMNLSKEMSETLTKIIMDSLYAIGGVIADTISSFFGQTGNFIEGGGLQAVGGAIIAFLGTVLVTTLTTVGTILFTFYTKIIPAIVREGMKIVGGVMLNIFEWITGIVSDAMTGVSRFVRDIFLGIVDFVSGLPLMPKDAKKGLQQYREELKQIDKAEDVIRKHNLKTNFGNVHLGAEQMSKDFDKGWNALFGLADEKAAKAGAANANSYKDGFKKSVESEAGKVVDTTSGMFSGLMSFGQINPLEAAEQSSANINTNLTSALTSMQNQYAWGLNDAMQAIPSVVPQVQPNMEKLQWVSGQTSPAIDQYAANMPVMGGNNYTINIQNFTVGDVSQAQEFLNNPGGTGEKPIINMGVNTGI